MKTLTLLLLLSWSNGLYSQGQHSPTDMEVGDLQQLQFTFSEKYQKVPKHIRSYLDSVYGSNFKVKRKGTRMSGDAQIGFGGKKRAITFLAQNHKYVVLSYEHSGRGKHYHTLIFSVSGKWVLRAYNFISMNLYDFDYFKMQIRNRQAYESESFDEI